MLEIGKVYELGGVPVMLERIDVESSPFYETEAKYVFRGVQPSNTMTYTPEIIASSTTTYNPEAPIATTTARTYDVFVDTTSSSIADLEEIRSSLQGTLLNTWDFSKIGSWKIPEKEEEKEADEENNPEDWLNLIGEA